LAVRDNGVGIPPEMASEVFEPFSQLEGTRDQSQGGLGVGLTLVKRLTELQNGSVSVESAGPGKGSVFRVRLPAPSAAQLAKPAAPPTPSVVPRPHSPHRVAPDNR